jgi:hypothetical protein
MSSNSIDYMVQCDVSCGKGTLVVLLKGFEGAGCLVGGLNRDLFYGKDMVPVVDISGRHCCTLVPSAANDRVRNMRDTHLATTSPS